MVSITWSMSLWPFRKTPAEFQPNPVADRVDSQFQKAHREQGQHVGDQKAVGQPVIAEQREAAHQKRDAEEVAGRQLGVAVVQTAADQDDEVQLETDRKDDRHVAIEFGSTPKPSGLPQRKVVVSAELPEVGQKEHFQVLHSSGVCAQPAPLPVDVGEVQVNEGHRKEHGPLDAAGKEVEVDQIEEKRSLIVPRAQQHDEYLKAAKELNEGQKVACENPEPAFVDPLRVEPTA